MLTADAALEVGTGLATTLNTQFNQLANTGLVQRLVNIEGYIPGAISIYDAQFEKNLDKLPKNKDNLIVFYCGGPT